MLNSIKTQELRAELTNISFQQDRLPIAQVFY